MRLDNIYITESYSRETSQNTEKDKGKLECFH